VLPVAAAAVVRMDMRLTAALSALETAAAPASMHAH
jgi:hypothetical protein